MLHFPCFSLSYSWWISRSLSRVTQSVKPNYPFHPTRKSAGCIGVFRNVSKVYFIFCNTFLSPCQEKLCFTCWKSVLFSLNWRTEELRSPDIWGNIEVNQKSKKYLQTFIIGIKFPSLLTFVKTQRGGLDPLVLLSQTTEDLEWLVGIVNP